MTAELGRLAEQGQVKDVLDDIEAREGGRVRPSRTSVRRVPRR